MEALLTDADVCSRGGDLSVQLGFSGGVFLGLSRTWRLKRGRCLLCVSSAAGRPPTPGPRPCELRLMALNQTGLLLDFLPNRVGVFPLGLSGFLPDKEECTVTPRTNKRRTGESAADAAPGRAGPGRGSVCITSDKCADVRTQR